MAHLFTSVRMTAKLLTVKIPASPPPILQSQELALATAKRSFKTHSQRRRKVKRREIQRNTVRGKVKTNRKNRDIRTIDLKQLNFSNL